LLSLREGRRIAVPGTQQKHAGKQTGSQSSASWQRGGQLRFPIDAESPLAFDEGTATTAAAK